MECHLKIGLQKTDFCLALFLCPFLSLSPLSGLFAFAYSDEVGGHLVIWLPQGEAREVRN